MLDLIRGLYAIAFVAASLLFALRGFGLFTDDAFSRWPISRVTASETLGARLSAALLRRDIRVPRAWYFAAALGSLTLAVLTLANRLTADVAWALFVVGVAIGVTASAFLAVSTSAPRVANLTPRRSTDAVPLWAFAAAVIGIVGSIARMSGAGLLVPAAAAFLTVAAWQLTARPAIITTEDFEAEAWTDGWLRRTSATWLLWLASMSELFVPALHQRGGALATVGWMLVVASNAIVLFAFFRSQRGPTQNEIDRMRPTERLSAS